jgi:hypothetical protein
MNEEVVVKFSGVMTENTCAHTIQGCGGAVQIRLVDREHVLTWKAGKLWRK